MNDLSAPCENALVEALRIASTHPNLRVGHQNYVGDSSVLTGYILLSTLPQREKTKRHSRANSPARLNADCLSLYAICSSIKDFWAAALTSTLMNNWIRPLGKHRRIISDNGPPCATGREWEGSPHTFCIHLVHAPKETPQQMVL